MKNRPDNDHLSAELMQAFLEGEIPPRDIASVEEHLASCARCSSEVDGWRVLFEDLGDLSSHRPHEGFADRVLSRVTPPVPVPLAARVRDRVEAGLVGSVEDHVSAEAAQDFLEGLLGPRRSRRIEQHLDICGRCSSEVDAWALVHRDLDTLATFRPRAGFAERVMASVEIPESLPVAARVRRRLAGMVRGDTTRHLTETVLQDFVDGVLPERTLARVRAHVGSCGDCAAEVHAWRSLAVQIRRLPAHRPSEHFAERVMAGYRVHQLFAAAAPVPMHSRVAITLRRWSNRPREAMAALGGLAVTPVVVLGLMAWAVFSHPSVTMGSLLSFMWWQLSDMVALATSTVGGVLSRAVTMVGGDFILETLTSSPVALGAVVLGYAVVCAFAFRVLYRNLAARPADGRYAHASFAS